MDRLVRHFRAMARNNLWANERLFEACVALSPSEFAKRRTGFFPSLRETLNHNHSVDLYYLDALEDGGEGRKLYTCTPMIDDPADLRVAQVQADQRLVAFCDRLNGDDLDHIIAMDRAPDGIFDERVDAILAHLFQHQIHHRGQAHAMLADTDIAPPQLDEFFLNFVRHPRAAEIGSEILA